MPVRRPLEKEKEKKVNVEALIDRGAPVKGETNLHQDKKWKFINIRLPQDMISEIDEIISLRIGISRTAWILEAIQEKIKKRRIISEYADI